MIGILLSLLFTQVHAESLQRFLETKTKAIKPGAYLPVMKSLSARLSTEIDQGDPECYNHGCLGLLEAEDSILQRTVDPSIVEIYEKDLLRVADTIKGIRGGSALEGRLSLIAFRGLAVAAGYFSAGLYPRGLAASKKFSQMAGAMQSKELNAQVEDIQLHHETLVMRWAFSVGDVARAEESVRTMRALVGDATTPTNRFWFLLAEASLAVLQGHYSDAQKQIDAAEALITNPSTFFNKAFVDIARSQAYRAAGDLARAESSAWRAVQAATIAGYTVAKLWALQNLVAAYRREGKWEAAETQAQQFLELGKKVFPERDVSAQAPLYELYVIRLHQRKPEASEIHKQIHAIVSGTALDDIFRDLFAFWASTGEKRTVALAAVKKRLGPFHPLYLDLVSEPR